MPTNSLKQSLLDFQLEMKSKLLEDTFTVHGKTWKMRMLNDEEQTWTASMMNTQNTLTLALSGRLANLAIGIREIDGKPVYEYFTDDWDELGEDTKSDLLGMNEFAFKYFVAEHLHSFIAAWPSEEITELWEKGWNLLEERRKAAQEMSKKSSGETLHEASNES